MSHALFAATNPLGFLTHFGVEWRLLVSQGISFGIVAVALYFLVFRPVIKMSSKRQEEIERGLKDAELARQKLAASQDEADARVRKAAQEATAILDQARENAKKTIEEAAREAAAKAARIRDDNEAQMERDRQRLKEELRAELAGLVVKATEAVAGEVLTPQQRGKLAEIAAEKISEK